jgi:hypothetical protein
MFIGTKRRKSFRLFSVIPAKAGIHVHRNEKAEEHPETFSPLTWTPDQARGDELLKDAGLCMGRCEVRLFSVIPAKAGIHVHRDETAEELPETFSPSTWTPDQARGDGVLKDTGYVRLFSVIPAKAGIHVHRDETAENLPETFSPSTWTPGQARGDELLKDAGFRIFP